MQRAALEDYLAGLRSLEADLIEVLDVPDDLVRQEQIDRQNQLIAVRQQITTNSYQSDFASTRRA